MPSKEIEVGATGQQVAANVAALRGRLRLTKVELGRRLELLGRPLSLDVLTKLEKGNRRVDADDLVALAAALDVSLVALLHPLAAPLDAGPRATGPGQHLRLHPDDEAALKVLGWTPPHPEESSP